MDKEEKEKKDKEREDKFREWINEASKAPPIRCGSNINKTIKELRDKISNADIDDYIYEIDRKFRIMKKTINFILCWIIVYSAVELCIGLVTFFK